MNAKQLGAALAAVAVVAMAGCSTTTTGVATAPDDVTPYTATSKTPPRTVPKGPRGARDLPSAAYDEVRAAGLEGSDSAIRNQIVIACIMGNSSFTKSKQDVVDALTQLGSNLSPDALMTIVTVALKYECPELAGKLGG